MIPLAVFPRSARMNRIHPRRSRRSRTRWNTRQTARPRARNLDGDDPAAGRRSEILCGDRPLWWGVLPYRGHRVGPSGGVYHAGYTGGYAAPHASYYHPAYYGTAYVGGVHVGYIAP
jgi:hypothetical protein